MTETNDPISDFAVWYAEAQSTSLRYPNAMALATVSKDGTPSVRIVLMKHFDHEGLVFYTNLESAKSQDIQATGIVSVCFHWEALGKQVRVTGHTSLTSAAEADEYFATRPRDSQIGAWASLQSRPMKDRAEFDARVAHYQQEFAGKAVPRPDGWSGWRINPERIEFWIERPYRLHDRFVYTRQAGKPWTRTILYP